MIRLTTQDGTPYFLIYRPRDEVELQTTNFKPRVFPSLKKALGALGGMVQWEQWEETSRDMLLFLNKGQAI